MKVRHGGKLGDVVWSLPTVIDLLSRRGVSQASFYLKLGQLMPESAARSLLPLLQAQPYIAEAAIHQGQPLDLDLDAFRSSAFDLGRGHIGRYYGYTFCSCPDLSQPWLTVKADQGCQDAIIVNRTERYHNPAINLRFLSAFPNVYFAGTWQEYTAARKDFGPGIPFLEVADCLELAEAIAGCRLFIGNQSFCFALAEALKVPRVLEVCPYVPNVVPNGPRAYDVIGQAMLEEIVAWEVSTANSSSVKLPLQNSP